MFFLNSLLNLRQGVSQPAVNTTATKTKAMRIVLRPVPEGRRGTVGGSNTMKQGLVSCILARVICNWVATWLYIW